MDAILYFQDEYNFVARRQHPNLTLKPLFDKAWLDVPGIKIMIITVQHVCFEARPMEAKLFPTIVSMLLLLRATRNYL